MKKATKLIHVGRPKIGNGTPVNPPITRASTLLFDKAEELYTGNYRSYGRHGGEVHDALKEAFCMLESGAGCSLTPSGLSANTLSLLSTTKSGDHVLLTDSAYGPVRHFCDTFLKSYGVETSFYDPRIGGNIGELIRPNTAVIACESPGSLSMEIQDLPAILDVAKRHNIKTIVDNTWSAGLVYNPLELGADIAVHAATKYYSGHSDILYGAVVSRTKSMASRVARTQAQLGGATSPDDAYQILRGFRTVATRFERQAATALRLAKWLSAHDKVARVLHPALKSHPDHKIWRRDFSGSACLFSVVLKPCTSGQVLKLLDRLKLFAKGYSFGGYESLIIHCDPQLKRSASAAFEGPLIRLACGLEEYEDLKTDLDGSFTKLKLKA